MHAKRKSKDKLALLNAWTIKYPLLGPMSFISTNQDFLFQESMSQCYARLLGNLNITYVTHHGKSHEITFVQSYLQTTLIARFESH